MRLGLEFGVGSDTDDAVHALPASYVGNGGAFWIACAPSLPEGWTDADFVRVLVLLAIFRR